MQNLRNKRGYVESLIDAILTKDIKKRFKVRNVDALKKIAGHLISNSCQEANYDELSDLFCLLGMPVDEVLRKSLVM